MSTANNSSLLKCLEATRIERDDSFEDAYAIHLGLTSAPSPEWIHAFYAAYDFVPYLLRREVLVAGTTLRLVVHKEDDLAQQIRLLIKAMQTADQKVPAADIGQQPPPDTSEIDALRDRLRRLNDQFDLGSGAAAH